MKQVTLHTNDTLDAMGKRFIDAWHRAEVGMDVSEAHIGFIDLQTMVAALTPKRMELLKEVHMHPAKDIKALSTRLHRDYKRVYEDVRELAEAGLLEKGDQGVRVPYDVIRAELVL